MRPSYANTTPFRGSRKKDPQESLALFRIAAKDFEDPALQYKCFAVITGY